MKNKAFVFVVCGSREHIDTLHFSLNFLKRFSEYPIYILTDQSRNEIPIQHDLLIDFQTPMEFNHHQASIFLKTGIYQFLPTGTKYCYLDTDVIAMSKEINSIFDHYVAPITFAPDHCKMNQFSPYAVQCTCDAIYDDYSSRIEKELVDIDPLRNATKQSIISNRKQLVLIYQKNNTFIKKIILGLKFFLSLKKFKLSDGIYFDKKTKTWKDDHDEVFMHHFRWRKVSKHAGLSWNRWKSYPQLPDGRSLWSKECIHLQQYIQNKFQVKISDPYFQHWNGGVFLFDEESHAFLKTWFESTMQIFSDSAWKTRDQGTLIKTVWQFGLEKHPTLSKKWNLIADFHNPFLAWNGREVQLSEKETFQPAFIHVYHHFGDENWPFWNELIEKINPVDV